jgi:AcrR family transcriptional regulator
VLCDQRQQESDSEGATTGSREDETAHSGGRPRRVLGERDYFNSKEGLFRAVLHQRLGENRPVTAEPGLSESERLLRLQDRMADSHEYIRLLMWEALERGNRTRLRIENKRMRQSAIDAVIETIEADQHVGIVADDVEAAQLALAELALIMFPHAFPQLTRLTTGLLPHQAEFAQKWKQLLVTIGHHLEPHTAT